ncbi:MAG: bacterial Ig-like domain-containing protein, partial [Treponema sp.]|nr:bacterial Ig-like domain-containing protein [Treponema sp.]
MKVKSICPLLAIAAAILAFALAFAACPGDDGPGKKTVAGIEITKLPDTTGYIAGEGLELDITGLEITVLYSDGSTIKITGGDLAGVTVSGFDPETEGPQTITVSYGGKSAVFTVTVTVMVTAAPSYAISASALKPFGALVTPYAQPEAQTVTVTNTGTGAVMLAQPSAEYYEIGELSALTLAANGDTASFTVRPKTGLAEGEYDESIDVYGMGGEGAPVNAAVSAAFIVTAAPTYDISASAL